MIEVSSPSRCTESLTNSLFEAVQIIKSGYRLSRFDPRRVSASFESFPIGFSPPFQQHKAARLCALAFAN